MTNHPYDKIQDPTARAEAMRAQAMADAVVGTAEAVRDFVKATVTKLAAHMEYRRTFDMLTGMSDRELDDIGISRGDIPAVARGIDPRKTAQRPGDALARRLAVAEAFEQETGQETGQETRKVAAPRANDNRPAAAA